MSRIISRLGYSAWRRLQDAAQWQTTPHDASNASPTPPRRLAFACRGRRVSYDERSRRFLSFGASSCRSLGERSQLPRAASKAWAGREEPRTRPAADERLRLTTHQPRRCGRSPAVGRRRWSGQALTQHRHAQRLTDMDTERRDPPPPADRARGAYIASKY